MYDCNACAHAQVVAKQPLGEEDALLHPAMEPAPQASSGEEPPGSHAWDFLTAGWHMLVRSLLLQVRFGCVRKCVFPFVFVVSHQLGRLSVLRSPL